MWQFSADLVTFTKEILTRKLHFLWSDIDKVEANPGSWTTEKQLWKSLGDSQKRIAPHASTKKLRYVVAVLQSIFQTFF